MLKRFLFIIMFLYSFNGYSTVISNDSIFEQLWFVENNIDSSLSSIQSFLSKTDSIVLLKVVKSENYKKNNCNKKMAFKIWKFPQYEYSTIYFYKFKRKLTFEYQYNWYHLSCLSNSYGLTWLIWNDENSEYITFGDNRFSKDSIIIYTYEIKNYKNVTVYNQCEEKIQTQMLTLKKISEAIFPKKDKSIPKLIKKRVKK